MQPITQVAGTVVVAGITYRVVNYLVEKERRNYQILTGQISFKDATIANAKQALLIHPKANTANNLRKIHEVYKSEDPVAAADREFPGPMRAAEVAVAQTLDSNSSAEARRIVEKSVESSHAQAHTWVGSCRQAITTGSERVSQTASDIASSVKTAASKGAAALEQKAKDYKFGSDEPDSPF